MLRGITKVVRDYVNTHIAHSAEDRDVKVPTYDDLEVVLDEFDRLLKRYYLLVDGSGLTTTAPTKQYQFSRPLLVAWAPDDRLLSRLRRGELPVDEEDPETLARTALTANPTAIEPQVLVGLLAKIDSLRAELG